MTKEGFLSELKDDKTYILDVIQHCSLKDVSKRLQADKEVVLKAVSIDGNNLKFASEKLKDDKEVVFEAIDEDGYALQYASQRLQADKEIVLLAIDNSCGSALEYASEELRSDDEVVRIAVLGNLNSTVKKYVSESIDDGTREEIEKFSEDWNNFCRGAYGDAMIQELKKEYIETGAIKKLLQKNDIHILDAFLNNWDNIEEFYSKYYKNGYPKVVICGINPGKNGAGKTGVPFVDFNSLSKLLPNVNETDIERSAQFFYEIIGHFGAEKFFETFYVTNVSWLGFIQNGKNVNYYNMPIEVREVIFDIYKSEIDAINPTAIISLSQEVQQTNKVLFEGDENIELKSLPHPNYCAFPKNKDACTEQYISLLSKYIH